ncbi:hypothetical protein [Thiorhodovibrio winogradskyi]|uniref:hypothetical protein n=1 Tax=Thiorhodovibrio winogradskyi TaxID=77007 RepID=UPI002E2BB255|nr:hypothetical protein [Thiorhodovibrio winogradskyi]
MKEQACRSGLATAEFGKKPSNYRAIIEKYQRPRLKDSDAAKFDWSNALGPKKGYGWFVEAAQCRGHGWAVCVSINGKNSYGAYTGYVPFFYLIKNGEVIYSDGSVTDRNYNCLNFDKQTTL